MMSFLTNCLVDFIGEECSGEGVIAQALLSILTGPGGVFAFCQSYPTLRCFLSPPNVRNRPSWYPCNRPIILRVLHQIMVGRPVNLQLLEDHPGELDPDGIHFSKMSGVNFVKDLHDGAFHIFKDKMQKNNKKAIIECNTAKTNLFENPKMNITYNISNPVLDHINNIKLKYT